MNYTSPNLIPIPDAEPHTLVPQLAEMSFAVQAAFDSLDPAFDIIGTDNATIDTAALQAAITALGTAGGVIRTSETLSLNASSLTYPSIVGSLTFDVYGVWRIQDDNTLTLPTKVHWEGLGGSDYTSFQMGKSARIIPPSSGIAVQLTSSAWTTVKNLTMDNVQGTGIRIGGTSLASGFHLENVAVTAANVSGAVPLLIDTTFWLWLENCAFSGAANSGPSIRIVMTFTGSYSGLIYIRNSRMNNRGLYFEGLVPGSSFGDIVVDDVFYENGLDSMFTFDLANIANYQGGMIILNNIASGDSNSVPALVKFLNPSPAKIQGLIIRNYFSQGGTKVLDTPSHLNGVDIQTTGRQPVSASLTALKEFTLKHQELMDQRWAGANAGMSPSMHPGIALDIPADMAGSSISLGVGTITTGQPAPDGYPTAVKVVEGTGVGATRASIRVGGTAGAVSVGDWFLAGYWAKAADTALQPTYSAEVSFNDSALRFDDGGSTPIFYVPAFDLVSLQGESWRVVSHAAQVTAVTTPGGVLNGIMDMQVYNTKPTVFWQPFIVKIPASLGYTFADVIRFQRYLTTIVPGAPQGSIALHAHQKLYLGGGTFATKPVSPAQITANQNDYAPGISYFIRLTSDASRNITGLATSQVEGEAHLVVNIGSNDIVLKHQDAASVAANRFLNSTGADITLTAGQAADAIYDGTTARWRVWKRN